MKFVAKFEFHEAICLKLATSVTGSAERTFRYMSGSQTAINKFRPTSETSVGIQSIGLASLI